MGTSSDSRSRRTTRLRRLAMAPIGAQSLPSGLGTDLFPANGASPAISTTRMRNHPIIVQKYGGACLETPARIRAVAAGLADLRNRGYRVVAIVSAMGKATDDLVR